jgi:hypothetical protein
MQQRPFSLMALAAVLLLAGCGGSGGGGGSSAPSNPPTTTTADYAKAWVFVVDGDSYATITFGATGTMTANSNSEFVSGSVTPTAGATCSISEVTSSTPPGGGAAVTITTTYVGTLATDKNTMFGTYSWSGGGSSGTGKWCATAQGQPYLTNADLAAAWTVNTDGASYANLTFNGSGAMTANTNTDYVAGSGSVSFTGGLGLVITEQTRYTPPGGTLTTVTSTYTGTANSAKNSLTGTYRSVAGSNQQTGTWTAAKVPAGPG